MTNGGSRRCRKERHLSQLPFYQDVWYYSFSYSSYPWYQYCTFKLYLYIASILFCFCFVVLGRSWCSPTTTTWYEESRRIGKENQQHKFSILSTRSNRLIMAGQQFGMALGGLVDIKTLSNDRRREKTINTYCTTLNWMSIRWPIFGWEANQNSSQPEVEKSEIRLSVCSHASKWREH